jgi:peroxiredoxin
MAGQHAPDAAPDAAPGRRARRVALAAGAAALAGLGAIAWVGLRGLRQDPRPAPDVTVTTIEGHRIALSELRGQVVVVNFWATSCSVCVREMPQLAKLHQQLAPRGLRTLAVAMPYDRPDFVLHYAQRNPQPFEIALDPVGEVSRALGPVVGTPTVVVIDRRGDIVRTQLGAFNPMEFGAFLERTLDGG